MGPTSVDVLTPLSALTVSAARTRRLAVEAARAILFFC